jgi:TonB family protein
MLVRWFPPSPRQLGLVPDERPGQYFSNLARQPSSTYGGGWGLQSFGDFATGVFMLVGRNSQPFERSTRLLSFAVLSLALGLPAVFVPPSLAQTAVKPDRKVIVSAKPDYPDILRRARVGGLVRLKATVLPNGTVSSVEILGGNPILAENAVTAVKKWKYVPSQTQTVEDVALTFSPN